MGTTKLEEAETFRTKQDAMACPAYSFPQETYDPLPIRREK